MKKQYSVTLNEIGPWNLQTWFESWLCPHQFLPSRCLQLMSYLVGSKGWEGGCDLLGTLQLVRLLEEPLAD